MKMQFEVKEWALPLEWAHSESWPKNGIYKVPGEPDKLYHVNKYGVNVIYDISHFQEIPEQSGLVSELLMLKAIAAAAHAKVLS